MWTQMPKGDAIDSDVSLDAYFCSQPWFRYGGRAITEECPAAMILMCVQSIVGVIIQVGLILWIPSQTMSLFSGLYGRHRFCQVYDANEQG